MTFLDRPESISVQFRSKRDSYIVGERESEREREKERKKETTTGPRYIIPARHRSVCVDNQHNILAWWVIGLSSTAVAVIVHQTTRGPRRCDLAFSSFAAFTLNVASRWSAFKRAIRL